MGSEVSELMELYHIAFGKEEQEMKITEKDFNCPGCMVEFRITVESDKDPDTVKDQYPKSIDWLSEQMICPVCSAELEEI